MSEIQVVLSHAVKLALVAVLAGLVARGRARLCWSFAAYLVAILVGNSLASLWPSRFYTPGFWVLKQAAYDVLKMAVALELAWRAFEKFPGAMRTARGTLLALLAASTLVPVISIASVPGAAAAVAAVLTVGAAAALPAERPSET